MSRKAFTLIELLVVIAIIAILAAILFPVFAQAKAAAKKTADLSNVKQMGTSTAIYEGDFDDLFPLQAGRDNTGLWGYNYNKYVPYDWAGANSSPLVREAYSQSFYMNSMQPYIKNYDILSIPGAPNTEYQPATIVAPGKIKRSSSYGFNGLLSSYASASIVNPAMLPVLSEVNGFAAGLGWGFANPALTCTTLHANCSYIPCGGTGNGSTSAMYVAYNSSTYWSYSQGENYSLGDTHAKFRRVGGTLAPGDTDYRVDPMTQYDPTGRAGYYWWDGCHPWLFRPDYDFNE
jgi:prepilin-type N-terminal cleavage/methylation domain-containing protein